MKFKITLIFLIIGGLFAANLRLAIPTLLVSVLGGFSLGFGLVFYTSVYSGKVWGIKIKAPSYAAGFVFAGMIMLIIGGFGVVHTALVAFTSLLSFDIIELLLSIIPFGITLAIAPIIAKSILERAMSKATNAQVFSQMDLFKEIDSNIGQATNFVVGFEGVALYSSTNYCYAVYLYDDYKLGTLTQVSEVAMVGSYFVQKYNDRFTFKVDEEIIPGTPGQTVVAVGAGGIAVGRISGTPDKRLFRSYIFTRKK